MKNLTLTLLFLGLFSGLSAQYVTIPDVEFRGRLMNLIPACFNQIGQMDTTCSDIRFVTSLSFLDNSYVASLEGIQYLDSLKDLEIVVNSSVNYIPAYPPGLKRFSYLPWGPRQDTFLTMLPSQLSYLMLGVDSIDIQLQLPLGLDTLVASFSSRISQLPQLPNGLSRLDIQGLRLINCLPNMPDSLRSMDISNTGIICLPGYNQFINQQTANLPVCGPTSPGCIGRSTAAGIIYNDTNMNGARDRGEGLVPNIPIYVSSTDWTTIGMRKK